MGDEMGLGKTIQVIAFLAGIHYSKLLSRHGRLVYCFQWKLTNNLGSMILSHAFFFSALEGWAQVSLCVPPQWCISGYVNSTYGGHSSELPSCTNLVPSMVRTVFHCLFFAEYYVLKLVVILLHSVIWISRQFFMSAFSCSISNVLFWIMGNCKYGGFQITTLLHLNVLFMGRLERFWHIYGMM